MSGKAYPIDCIREDFREGKTKTLKPLQKRRDSLRHPCLAIGGLSFSQTLKLPSILDKFSF